MKKQLLLLILPMLLFTATTEAQIKYWDFGGKELGAGYDNMLPINYLNALSAKKRNLNWANASGVVVVPFADGDHYIPATDKAWEYENGESRIAILDATYNGLYNLDPITGKGDFEIGSGKDDGSVTGIYISGASGFTKPTLLPDLDGTTNMGYMRDSDSDRLLTVNKSLTRYDERTGLPDASINPTMFPGCIQFTTPGEKRWDRSGGRGFSMQLAAGEYLTVVGSGQYVDIDDSQTVKITDPRGDDTTTPVQFCTGIFQFQHTGPGVAVDIRNFGTGSGNDNGPIDGTDQGDQSVRVMEFQAVSAGPYVLRNRGGKIRIYRMYVSSTSIKSSIEALLGVDDVSSAVFTDVKAVGNRIYISNVTSKTEVNIYSITGALVKTIKTTEATNFEFRAGLYIATVKTSEGQKSVKLLLK